MRGALSQPRHRFVTNLRRGRLVTRGENFESIGKGGQPMLSHAVESIEIAIPTRELCSFLAEPQNLPKWTNAFMRVSDKSATMKTEGGSVRVGLEVVAAAESGSVD